MHDFAGLSEIEDALDGLGARDEPLVVRLERQSGQKETRFAQLLGGPVDAAAYAPPAGSGWSGEDRPARPEGAATPAVGAARSDRVAALEARLAALESEMAILQAEHRELRDELGLGRPTPSAPGGLAAEPDADPGYDPE
jgi:uncharacterized protein YceH (UPF0502 family)